MVFSMRLVLAALAAISLLSGQQPPPEVKPTPEEDQVIKINVDLVNLFFSARDRHGAYLTTLTQDDFFVYENGVQQTAKFFTRETNQPLTIGLLVDVSKSQEALIEVEREASYRFFQRVLRPKDMAFLISFGIESELLQDFTSSASLLGKGLKDLRLNAGTGGIGPTPSTMPSTPRGTVLYDAVYVAAHEKLRGEAGRKALVVITDGVDFGSRVKVEKAIEEAQRADTIIYAVLYEDYRYSGGFSGDGVMRKMAEETGGRMFRVDRKNTLEQIYDTIQEEMRSQYSFVYAPTNPARDDTFRKIDIKPKSKDVKIQARRGYYAAK